MYALGVMYRMKQNLEKGIKIAKLPPHEYRALEDRFMTEIDLKGERGVPPADGCLGQSSARSE